MKNMITIKKLKCATAKSRLAHFIHWLGTKPRDTPYNFNSVCSCALAQYGKALRPWWLPAIIMAGGRDVSLFPWGIILDVIPAEFGGDSPLHHLIKCRTLGQLHDRLSPLVVIPMSDAELDAIETRALVDCPATPKKLVK